MNDDQIFIKTAAGDEAVRERTRLVQRNLRMVLILVDGAADVGVLKQKTGDPAMVEAAVQELQELGLIELRDAFASRVAQAVPAPPTLTEEMVAEPALPEHSISADTVFDKELAVEWTPPPNANSIPWEKIEQSESGPLAKVGGWWTGLRERRRQAREDAVYEKAYGQENSEVVSLRPSRRKLIAKWIQLASVAAAAALVLAILRVVLYPYDEYRPELERRLSQVLNDPVTIGSMRVSFMPMPVIVLDKVSVGAPAYATAETVRLAPEAGSLFDARRIQEARIESLRIRDVGAARFSRWFQPAGMGDAAIGRITVEDLALDFAGGTIDGLTGSADMGTQGGLARLALRKKEGDFRVDLVPTPAGMAVSLAANDWKTQFRPSLAFGSIELKGELAPGRLTLERLEGRAYDGQFDGSGTISWDSGSARMNLELGLQHMASARLVAALGGASLVEGEADGKLMLTAAAPTLGRLGSSWNVNGSYKIVRGSLTRMNLAGALKSPGHGGASAVRGGSTGFEEFAGSVASDARSFRLTGLKLSSGLLQATGQATISRQEAGGLSGLATVEMRGSAGPVKTPVSISGSVESPELKPGR